MKNWIVRESIPEDVSSNLSSYPRLLQEFMYWRGIEDARQAEIYLHPQYERDLHDPYLLSGMERAARRIALAINAGDRIAIFTDYDADGIPGGVVLSDFFNKIKYKNFEVYIPHRYREGYGLNKTAIKNLADSGAKLLITIDCGITNVAEVAYANELGVDVIITDHHLPGDTLPDAYVVVNPNQELCNYPNNNLCGGGLAFKIVQALVKVGVTLDPEGWEKWLLDVAGISTISDMVPLVGENRALASLGIRVLRRGKRQGLVKLFQKRRVSLENLTEEDVGFLITPHINTASRMSEPKTAFELLETGDAIRANDIVSHLHDKNEERKEIVEKILMEIEEIFKETDPRDVISLGDISWQPGLLGLAANRVVEKYGRPVCLWGMAGSDVARGSCRSDGTVNIVSLMNGVRSNYFIDSGGHEFSGGFATSLENTKTLEEELLKAHRNLDKADSNNKEIHIDKKAKLSDVTHENIALLRSLAPFGIGNEKPLFLFESLEIAQTSAFGKAKNHLKVMFKKGNEKMFPAIQFFATTNGYGNVNLERGARVDVAANMEEETFRGRKTLRLRIVDMKNSQS